MNEAPARGRSGGPVMWTPVRRPSAKVDSGALDKAARVLRDNPGITNAEAARRAQVSPKTVQRARPLAAAAPKGRSNP